MERSEQMLDVKLTRKDCGRCPGKRFKRGLPAIQERISSLFLETDDLSWTLHILDRMFTKNHAKQAGFFNIMVK
jgi:hypothetical protein